ncbi:MAG: SDR family oxidoreductase [Myxococcales bacterium]|nr:SDR family oxidoreductase [Myxococcales bacterium]
MRTLVTGGAGFIGGHLVDALLARGAKVKVLDNFSTGRRENIEHNLSRIELIEGDVRDVECCARATRDVDVVFHQAALPSVARSVEAPIPTNDVNAGGTVNLLDAARRAGVTRFVFAASSSAYGETEVLPKVETMAPQPLSPYAVSKLAGEQYLQVFARLYGMKTCALRYFNVFGPRQDPRSDYAAVVPKFCTAILSGKSPVIFGDGGQTRDFTFIDNVVEANLLAATKEVSGQVVNIACGERISLLDLARIINELAGKNIAPSHGPARAGDIRHSLADISAARSLLGFAPIVSVRDGLAKTLEFYRAHVS